MYDVNCELGELIGRCINFELSKKEVSNVGRVVHFRYLVLTK